MKKFELLGRSLTKMQQKKVMGGNEETGSCEEECETDHDCRNEVGKCCNAYTCAGGAQGKRCGN